MKIKTHAEHGFCFYMMKSMGTCTGAEVNDMPVACQSRDPACPAGQASPLASTK